MNLIILADFDSARLVNDNNETKKKKEQLNSIDV
jgi:hypothetical protein